MWFNIESQLKHMATSREMAEEWLLRQFILRDMSPVWGMQKLLGVAIRHTQDTPDGVLTTQGLHQKVLAECKVDPAFKSLWEKHITTADASTVELREVLSRFGEYQAHERNEFPYYPFTDAVNGIDTALHRITCIAGLVHSALKEASVVHGLSGTVSVFVTDMRENPEQSAYRVMVRGKMHRLYRTLRDNNLDDEQAATLSAFLDLEN